MGHSYWMTREELKSVAMECGEVPCTTGIGPSNGNAEPITIKR